MKIRTLAIVGLTLAAAITARHAWSSRGEVGVPPAPPAPPAPSARSGALRELAARAVEVAREPPMPALAIPLATGAPVSSESGEPDEVPRSADLEAFAELVASARDGHGALHGRIVDVDGVPVAGATITVESRAGDAPALIAYTDEDGRYQVPHIPSGDRVVTVDGLGMGFVPQAITIEANAVAGLDVQPHPSNLDYVINIPTGRTFEAVLGSVAGSQVDSIGVSISSHCGVENVYILDELEVTTDTTPAE